MIDKESRNELLAKAFNGFEKQHILSEKELSSSEQSVIFYNKVEDLDYWAVRIELIEKEKLHIRVIDFIKSGCSIKTYSTIKGLDKIT